MEEKKTWGGARNGAGRKSIDPATSRITISVTVSRATRAVLNALAAKKGVKIGRLIDEWAMNLNDNKRI